MLPLLATSTLAMAKIQELENELQSFKQQLNNYRDTPTIETAKVGDVLQDGCIVLKKENGLALLVAPKSTEEEPLGLKNLKKSSIN
jgi:hypothetical protein